MKKIKTKKDIVIPKGTEFDGITDRSAIYDPFVAHINFIKDSTIEINVWDYVINDNPEYFEVIDDKSN